MKSYRFSVRGRLLSINQERKVHLQRRAEFVRQWRTDAGWEIRRARVPHLERVSIVAHVYQHAARLGDAGNHLPTIKAIVDALIDVGVLDDDGPDQVASLTLIAPKRTELVDRVEIELIPTAQEAVA